MGEIGRGKRERGKEMGDSEKRASLLLLLLLLPPSTNAFHPVFILVFRLLGSFKVVLTPQNFLPSFPRPKLFSVVSGQFFIYHLRFRRL